MPIQVVKETPFVPRRFSPDALADVPLSQPRKVAQPTDVFVRSAQSARVSQADFQVSLNEILTVSRANTLNPDTEGVANRLKPHFEVVESYFAQNRPANEVELTRGVWKQLWYKNPDIEDLRGPARLKDDKIYQDVRDGYYMNVSEAKLFGIFNVRGFLRGNYTLTNVANAQNSGEKKLNVIALEFADSRSGFGRLKKNKSIAAQVDEVVSGKAKTFKTPGPKGIRGELWNIYVDENIRICRGSGGRTNNNNEQYYVLERSR
jgi:hypothetical protein